ncbi:YitT family protein [Halodurantibacterium flavum]|uniref:YitT family protein n=1 Tax=Halodurantibacterium flavum TaxID=1382802 RepID=A0ABW4S3T3_9RHOB
MTEPQTQTQSPAPPARHTVLDDAQGILFGVAMCAFGLVILTSAGFVTGQTAGLAVLIAYATGLSFGWVFFAINLPFYALALRRMGMRFTLRTFAAVAGLSALSAVLPQYVGFDRLHPAAAAVLFGLVTGAGLLALFRHGASLGGVGIVALYLQDKTGFRAGWSQLIFDVFVFGAALFVLDPVAVGWSLLGAAILNLVIAVNHRRDRYIAT